jgi:hypothetical protein
MYFSKKTGRGNITSVKDMKYKKAMNALVSGIKVLICGFMIFCLANIFLAGGQISMVRAITNVPFLGDLLTVYFPDTIVLNNGREVSGRITGEKTNTLVLRILIDGRLGAEVSFPKADIKSIKRYSRA